jgi:tetratricopeptide (TPR) repeat protein
LFLRAAALAPESTDAYDILGAEALKRKRWDDARAAFRQVAALNPRDAKAHLNLGRLALQAGDASAAESSYRAALRADPGNAKALNDLGAMYLQRRDWSLALEPLTAALQRDPESIEASYNRAVVLVGLGRRDEGLAALQGVLARLPPDPEFDPYRRGAQYLLDGGEP